MVQATLASMRHYCPDVPICLTVDGDVDVSDLKKQWPFTIARLEHHRRHHDSLGAWMAVVNEETRVFRGKFQRPLQRASGNRDR